MLRPERPSPAEIPSFYRGYVADAPGGDLMGSLGHAAAGLGQLSELVDDARGAHRYAPGKWSIKEVVQHVSDTERVLAYRALRFARNDATELPGFDENTYAPASAADRRSMDDLLQESALLRTSTITLFSSFDPAMLERQGTANGHRMSVRALGWIIAGHAAHHLRIIHQRYL